MESLHSNVQALNLVLIIGPGNCLGLLASKSSATAIRGQFYGLAAAIGKVGAFVGTWGTSSYHCRKACLTMVGNHSIPSYDRWYAKMSCYDLTEFSLTLSN